MICACVYVCVCVVCVCVCVCVAELDGKTKSLEGERRVLLEKLVMSSYVLHAWCCGGVGCVRV